jgi:RHS repeat-associated protein
MWQFDGGYVDLDENGSPTSWNYYVTDHLGSTRKVVGSDNTVRETINYYPFGSEMTMQDPAQMTNDFQHPYRFTGKELDRLNGLNMYDFGARWYDVAGVPMWTSVDPLAEKYYHVSPYAYCNNNPVIFIDPNGEDWTDCDGNKLDNTDNTKVFIFYSADFADQAKVQYDEAINKYGEGTVAMSLTSTTEEFAKDWGNMGGKYIANVMIMTHGKNQSITLDGGDNQLTSTGDGLTNLRSNDAMNVQDLPTPKGNISKAVLNMYSCHSADKTEAAHGEGIHAQGALKGTKDPIAYAFARKFNFKGVKGTTESVNYHSFLTDGTSILSKNYLKPYPANGGRWTYIKK